MSFNVCNWWEQAPGRGMPRRGQCRQVRSAAPLGLVLRGYPVRYWQWQLSAARLLVAELPVVTRTHGQSSASSMGFVSVDLFAGIPVRDYTLAVAWYEQLLEHAGHAMHTLFVGDFDDRIAQIAERGLEPAECETYAGGVRKSTFRDPGRQRDWLRRRPAD